MKRIAIIFTILLSVTISLKAQTDTIVVTGRVLSKAEFKKGAYYTYPELKNFEGTWVYKSENETFKIHIKHVKKMVGKGAMYIGVLEGNYCYAREKDCDIDDILEPTLKIGSPINRDIIDAVSFFFVDSEKGKSGRSSLKLQKDGTARWRLGNEETIIINGKVNGKNWDRTFSVPTDVIMTKVE